MHLQRVQFMKLATGESDEALTEDGKNKAAVELGRRGGLARAKSISMVLVELMDRVSKPEPQSN